MRTKYEFCYLLAHLFFQHVAASDGEREDERRFVIHTSGSIGSMRAVGRMEDVHKVQVSPETERQTAEGMPSRSLGSRKGLDDVRSFVVDSRGSLESMPPADARVGLRTLADEKARLDEAMPTENHHRASHQRFEHKDLEVKKPDERPGERAMAREKTQQNDTNETVKQGLNADPRGDQKDGIRIFGGFLETLSALMKKGQHISTR